MEKMTLDDAIQLVKPYARTRIFAAVRDPAFPFDALEELGNALGLTDVSMEIVFRRNFGFDRSVRMATLLKTVKPSPSTKRQRWSTFALTKRIFRIRQQARCFSKKEWGARKPATGREARMTAVFDASSWDAIPKVKEEAQSLGFVYATVDIGTETALHFYPNTIGGEVLLADSTPTEASTAGV